MPVRAEAGVVQQRHRDPAEVHLEELAGLCVGDFSIKERQRVIGVWLLNEPAKRREVELTTAGKRSRPIEELERALELGRQRRVRVGGVRECIRRYRPFGGCAYNERRRRCRRLARKRCGGRRWAAGQRTTGRKRQGHRHEQARAARRKPSDFEVLHDPLSGRLRRLSLGPDE